MKTLKLDLFCPKCNYHEVIDHVKGTVIKADCPKCNNAMTWKYLNDEKPGIFDEASKIINEDRQDSYGAPEDSFQIIASFWSIYLKHVGKIDVDIQSPLTALDVAHMMILLKIARMLGQKPNRDNYIDAAGYLAIAADRLIRWPEPFNSEEF